MFKTLLKIKLKGLFLKQTNSQKGKTSGIGKMILITILFGYVAVVSCGMFGMLFDTLVEPFHLMKLDWLYFALMGIIVIMFCFIGSVFITEHEMYHAKDNDLLLSMPIKNFDILLSRIAMILLLDYIYELIIVGPALFVYMTKIGMSLLQVLIFIIVCLTLPLLTLALSCLIAWLIAQIMAYVKHQNIIALVAWIAFFGLYFYGINYLQEYVTLLVSHGQSIAQAIKQTLIPIYHMAIAIQDGNFISLLIYLILTLGPFVIVMVILSRHFIKIATRQPKVKKKKYIEKPMKQNHLFYALLKREIKHLTSQTMVLLNSAMGFIFQIIATIALIFYASDIKALIVHIPTLQSLVAPMIILVSIAMNSMTIITASSISLEGDRLWIIKSLPIHELDILHAKLGLHVLFCLPTQVIFCMVASFLLSVSIKDMFFILTIPLLLIVFVALFGLLINLWKPKFDWVNETVCVKQSVPVMLTMMISMATTFAIAFVYVKFLSPMISIHVYMSLLFILFISINMILYRVLKTWGVNKMRAL